MPRKFFHSFLLPVPCKLLRVNCYSKGSFLAEDGRPCGNSNDGNRRRRHGFARRCSRGIESYSFACIHRWPAASFGGGKGLQGGGGKSGQPARDDYW